MEDLLERSARYIDEGTYEGPAANNPTDATFHQVADDIGVVTAFSHVWALRSAGELAVFDTSGRFMVSGDLGDNGPNLLIARGHEKGRRASVRLHADDEEVGLAPLTELVRAVGRHRPAAVHVRVDHRREQ